MNNRRVARVVAIILALIMLISILYGAIGTLTAKAVTQSEIDKLRDEKKQVEQRKREIQARINTIEFEKLSEIAKKSVLDERILLTGQEIDNIRDTINLYSVLISEKEMEVIAAQSREDAQLALYRRRVRDLEENGIISYLEILFDSTSFTDLLARLDFVSDIMQADERTYYDLINARQETEAAKADLEQTKVEMEQEEVLLEEREEELLAQLDEADAIIQAMEDDADRERELYAEESAEADRMQREINSLVEKLRQEQEAAKIREQDKVRGTGDFAWPTPGYTTITSPFGTRMHPIYKEMRTHYGIDISAPHGARVIAADHGTVITSSYNSSYGNYIVISHGNNRLGNNVTTLYAHLSSRNVREGARVARGDTIGRVGSTGVSTGPHLHFEVSINGTRVNPQRYL